MTSLSIEDPYAQAPLDLSGRSFRLVELQLCDSSDLIKCCLTTHPLPPDCPSYIALSYMWDHESPKDTIELNGVSFQVGHSLWTFLNQMRLNEMFGTYWIDALCINQADVRERNHQVELMGSIYSQADSVSIWLGEATEGSWQERAMNLLDSGKDDWLHACQSWTSDQETTIRCFFEHEYWNRMWIMQEVILANFATVHCGAYDFEYSILAELPNAFKKDLKRTPAALLIDLVKKYRRSQPIPLYEVMGNGRQFEATDFHDKVYALFGIVEEGTALAIPVDYTTTALEQWRKVFSYTCQTIERTTGHWSLECLGDTIAGVLSESLEAEVQQEKNQIIRTKFLTRPPTAEMRAVLELPDASNETVYFEMQPSKNNPKGLISVHMELKEYLKIMGD